MNFWSLSTGRLWIFFSLSKNMYGRILSFFEISFLLLRTLTHDETTVHSVSKTKGRSPKICWFWCWCSCGAVYTVFVCLFSVFFVHFVSIGPFQWREHWISAPPPHPLQTCIIHKHGLFFNPRVIYRAMTFYYFLCYFFFIFYMHILINMYICCVFFCLFFLTSSFFWCFPYFIIIIWDESGTPSESRRSAFISEGERSRRCFHSTFCPDTVFPRFVH